MCDGKLVIGISPDRGRGVFVKSTIRKGTLVCEYKGKLLTKEQAEQRGCQYDAAATAAGKDVAEDGCYMFWFCCNGVDMCIDASQDDGSFGRMINHSKQLANVKPIAIDKQIFFVALRRLFKHEELFYDYGEDDPKILNKFPWLCS